MTWAYVLPTAINYCRDTFCCDLCGGSPYHWMATCNMRSRIVASLNNIEFLRTVDMHLSRSHEEARFFDDDIARSTAHLAWVVTTCSTLHGILERSASVLVVDQGPGELTYFHTKRRRGEVGDPCVRRYAMIAALAASESRPGSAGTRPRSFPM